MKGVSVGIHVPAAAVAPLGSGESYVEFFRQAEALGLDALWTEDRIFHQANLLDPLMLLASAASCTRRIQLGTAVLVLTLRNVAVVARQVSTLHHLSGGSPFGTVADFPRAWSIVCESARAAGRDPKTLTAGRLVYVAVDEQRDRAREALRTFLHGYYGTGVDVDQHAIFGPAPEVAARLREHVEAGISRLMLGVPTLDLAHLRRVAEEVAPVVREAAAR